jgi:hypothetical protein
MEIMEKSEKTVKRPTGKIFSCYIGLRKIKKYLDIN